MTRAGRFKITRARARSTIALLLLLAIVVQTACSSSLPIYSRPEGAQVVMDDDKYLGETPILLKEQAWVWTSHTLTFTQAGYRPKTIKVRAQPRLANIAFCLLGACISWMITPVFFLGDYKRDVVVNLTPISGASEQLDPFGANTDTPSSSAPTLLKTGASISFREQ